MTWQRSPECTGGHYGALKTDRLRYRPLDTVQVVITGRAQGDTRCRIRVHDAEQRPYFQADVPLVDNQGQTSFQAAGCLGAHYLYLDWPDQSRHSRYLNIQVDCQTAIDCPDADLNDLLPRTRELMQLGRRDYQTPRGKMVGYISADTWHFDGIWLRDWTYGLPAYQYWETEMTCGLDRFLECQSADGMLPDGIERSGKTWRVGLESDVEYIMTMAVFQTWQATGDDHWLAQTLPRLEAALDCIRSDAKHWDDTHSLIKRQHSCDTWDFDIDGAGDGGSSRHVIATCDQSGYTFAFRAMSRMHAHLGHEEAAKAWAAYAEHYRERAAELLWDGNKFQHHVHLDPIDHGDFDESEQLAMGNTWAMTRGLATPEQARSIISEYQQRHQATGDAYPWWSLQPGYPDHLGYFGKSYCRQGGYANGGLMPWVGGELCRAAFRFGRERYGVDLLRHYMEHLRRTGGVQVWYWPDGEPGFRTTNEVPYAGWGMAEWLQAAVQGLAGVEDLASQLTTVGIAPRWSAADIPEATVRVRYAATKAYVAYSIACDAQQKVIRLSCTGSGQTANLQVLLPDTWEVLRVTWEQQDLEVSTRCEDQSRYACFSLPLSGLQAVLIHCRER